MLAGLSEGRRHGCHGHEERRTVADEDQANLL
jgi:hypothetical protein